jgi:hypothetical protein
MQHVFMFWYALAGGLLALGMIAPARSWPARMGRRLDARRAARPLVYALAWHYAAVRLAWHTGRAPAVAVERKRLILQELAPAIMGTIPHAAPALLILTDPRHAIEKHRGQQLDAQIAPALVYADLHPGAAQTFTALVQTFHRAIIHDQRTAPPSIVDRLMRWPALAFAVESHLYCPLRFTLPYALAWCALAVYLVTTAPGALDRAGWWRLVYPCKPWGAPAPGCMDRATRLYGHMIGPVLLNAGRPRAARWLAKLHAGHLYSAAYLPGELAPEGAAL